jgi:peptidoglycan/xylan/chitin deacetylase (PgdA/CDA1 family)
MSDPVLYTMAKQRARYWMSRCWRDRHALMAFMFHAVVEDRDELERDLIDPTLCITVQEFRDFIQFYQAHGYQFVAPSDVVSGLPTNGKYVLITFDDGYFNNKQALPILQELQVPAVFCIATAYVESGKSYWWDVLYRGRIRQATPPRKIAEELKYVKSLLWSDIEPYLTQEFGTAALDSTGDADRPFRPDELVAFSQQPFVHLGNHTSDHAILTNLSVPEARRQIATAQEELYRMCGVTPQLIAYPNGAHSAPVRQAAKESGLVLGVSVEKRKNYLPLEQGQHSLLNLRQCERVVRLADSTRDTTAPSLEDSLARHFAVPWHANNSPGYVLVQGQEIVGFMATLTHTRQVRDQLQTICNLASWYVDEISGLKASSCRGRRHGQQALPCERALSNLAKITSVRVVMALGYLEQTFSVDKAHAVRDFLDAGDLETLAFFNDADELTSLK